MKSYLFCLCVCHLKIIFCICICICICNFVFLEGGNKAKKNNFEVLDDIFWRGKTKKTVRLIEIQSLRSITLWYECSHIKIESIIKGSQADKGAKGAQLSNILFLQATELHWPGQCVSIVYRQGGLAPSGRLCVAQHTWDEGQGCLDETCATRGSSQVHYCTLHINAYYCILTNMNEDYYILTKITEY